MADPQIGRKVSEAKTPESAPASARVRSRLARIGGKSASAHPVLDPLLKVYRATHPKGDVQSIQKAYGIAAEMHEGQTRKSGDPYITHPLAVATILAELGMTAPTLCAALLHDTVEDTAYTIDQLQADFGEEVVHLVDGVTKLDKVKYGDSAQSETIRKMIIAMSRDIRVLVIKLADRLHNMRTLRYLRQDKQERIARETIEIYAPLAHRLGMNTIKWELEDLAFGTLHPKVYDEIVRLVAERAPSRESFLERVITEVTSDLGHAKIKAKVTGRPKHYYSIYQKMLVRGREFSDIFDLVGVRILVDDVADCYAVLGVLHARWNPIPGRFKDYISVPKFNMYQSLHTTVIGPQGKPVELQIRTYAMHRRAEYGVAAHWKYKEDALAKASAGKPGKNKAPGTEDMVWLRELMDWQSETADSSDFLDSLRFEMTTAGVYAYTPRGDLIQLPAAATPVDFAYAVHTEVGHACIGARVNGRLVPLESELESGDVVEIFTSKSPDAGPSRDWLDFVKSPRARNKIRQWFTKERREEAIEHGKDLIAKQMRKEGLPLHRLFSQQNLDAVAKDLGLADISALYAAVGENNVGPQNVVERVIDLAGGREGAEEDIAEATSIPTSLQRPMPTSRSVAGVEVEGVDGDIMVKLARCCTPVPGDSIAGFVTRTSGVSVHRRNCPNFQALQGEAERIVRVSWAPTAKSMFLVAIQVEALDRPRLLSDITRVISDQHVNILSAGLSTGRDRVAKTKFTFEMADPKHLGHVLSAVRSIDGVFDVYRLTTQ
ncbi:bifunctional (p)ppGpp synthetase/guanosine-3',5'-bis(diphosphate) 3'-pyrophosphohydrolase [Aeromicrobium phragmitis]|uniref:Bifunctional (P)ppGpp synthetase/guanosine-3',5'-bis(Diphosphate) 3'-pyrophosphohydrolase n=1 Tax=Aeromicrobium phragmitis TaxID=2478914 RepID=A0A3L8PJK4_9ACTN|nr:bifunctional (p)ppGpp synthetase/guanosine-3',5'-bis(diphosphate) 3'-pyrophosphohydrolase [Aeromicrobium phragmitis]RLV55400.1 bifunctional (p)ppGpp synthetase/guanosine-3',5'-bis(diphosphate) 3'-pyrophosphohydrolase [Aeromicrobium phragmitis]